MAIGGYSTNGYSWLFLVMAINRYFIGGQWCLLMMII